ncbi:sigma-70 family RNA polymerase sigma factor [Macrococcus capreoli]|uniref:sigma-70 family RNA polymerase sigma factor n=1 Tax=Macrococcus capreoli TaxID=2982690 RepID=UPI003EE5F2BD
MLSLFVMDVSGSTKFDNSDEISRHLIQLTQEIAHWTQSVNFKYINFRMGDELFFVSDSLCATLFTSYYIKLLWPFKKQPIKFGIAVSDDDIPTGNLEHWNAAIIKQARRNLDEIKHSEVSDFYITMDDERTILMNNVLFPYLTEIIYQLSPMQRQVILLSFVYEQQKEIAQLLNKSVSTVSEHLKKGHKKQLSAIEAAMSDIDDTFDFSPFIKIIFKESALC